MRVGDRVLLKSFNGTLGAPDDVEEHEDYWKLIGHTGVVVDDGRQSHFFFQDGHLRMLISFDADLKKFDLENHNSFANSLWIRINDLELLS